MARERRHALLDWASATKAWIIEDDYLGELQLDGRAAPALMSLDRGGRVLNAGTFSKTISLALRLGYLIVPSCVVADFADVAAALAPASNGAIVDAVTAFMAEGHYLRHLRRTKRVYATRRRQLLDILRAATNDVPIRIEANWRLRDHCHAAGWRRSIDRSRKKRSPPGSRPSRSLPGSSRQVGDRGCSWASQTPGPTRSRRSADDSSR